MATLTVDTTIETLYSELNELIEDVRMFKRNENFAGLYRGVRYLQIEEKYGVYRGMLRERNSTAPIHEQEQIPTYLQWMQQFSFAIDGKTNRNLMTNVARFFIMGLEMGALDHTGALIRDSVETCLLNMPFYRLDALRKYIGSVEEAREILAHAAPEVLPSRQEFYAWLAERKNERESEVTRHMELSWRETSAPIWRASTTVQYYPDLNWNTIMRQFEFPKIEGQTLEVIVKENRPLSDGATDD